MRRLAGLLLVAVLALVAAGCGGTASRSAATEGASSTAAVASSVAPASGSGPTRLEVDKISARSTLIPLRKSATGEIESPDVKTPQQAGWYSLGVVPGQPGPAVVLGHVDGGGKPGIFKRLNELRLGDVARVVREDGSILKFEVYDVETAPKDAFPTSRVYGNTAGPELRLITCGGAFLGGDIGYAENVIAYLRLQP